MSTRKLVQLSLLVSGAAVLHVVEGWLPVPLPVPGAKLGLANIVTLAVVLQFGVAEGVLVAGMRSFLGSLLGGTFLTVGFYLSFSGAVVSAFVMGTVYMVLGKRVGSTGISLLGAVTHNITQLFVASLLVSHFGLFAHLPVLMFFALPTGYFVGIVGGLMHRHMPRR